MTLDQLKDAVCLANLELKAQGLVTLTWGNVSAVDRERGVMVIKPSGVAYNKMTPADMVVVNLADGKVRDGVLRPSSDTPTHLVLYRAWPSVGGIVHTHSRHATIWAQAQVPIPCYGTTHADHVYGDVPVTRLLSNAETESDYEANTGVVIVEHFAELDPKSVPAVLVAGHGPFAWGDDATRAVANAVALEEIAAMALGARQLAPDIQPIPDYIRNKHYFRKHGANAYYGQASADSRSSQH